MIILCVSYPTLEKTEEDFGSKTKNDYAYITVRRQRATPQRDNEAEIEKLINKGMKIWKKM